MVKRETNQVNNEKITKKKKKTFSTSPRKKKVVLGFFSKLWKREHCVREKIQKKKKYLSCVYCLHAVTST